MPRYPINFYRLGGFPASPSRRPLAFAGLASTQQFLISGTDASSAFGNLGVGALTFADQRVLEFRRCTDAASRERLYDSPQVIEIAREPIHAIGDDRVAVANKTHQRFKLLTLGVFARGFVRENATVRRVRKLAPRVPLKLLRQA